jgi:Na+-transporting NADH:ubiquinone oxidoreductase subunit A
MANYKISKGMDIKLAGAPEPVIAEAMNAGQVAIYPTEYAGIKPRLKVKEGDLVKRGTPLIFDKRNPAFQVCSPAGGKVVKVDLGKRRLLERIVVEVDSREQAESFPKFTTEQLAGTDRKAILDILLQTGLLALVIARPFSRMANAAVTPKSIFVNGMATAPYQPDINVIIPGQEHFFQAGINALSRLTDGKVHVCLSGAKQNAAALTNAKNAVVHYFTGPHPSGNTSVHISRIDPIKPGQTVWTVKAQDVILIGQLLVNGEYPSTRVVTVSGPGVLNGSARYYRVRLNGSLAPLFKKTLDSKEVRIIGGDIFTGTAIAADSYLRLYDQSITVLPEDRERHFVGWMAPGLNRLSASRTFISKWLGLDKNKTWTLGTNQRGELRPMVLTGLYDRYMPMDIMVDYLVRAVLARDSDEAIALGLLETDPEDFALCAFVCPCKVDLCGIIRGGLDQVEKEGI